MLSQARDPEPQLPGLQNVVTMLSTSEKGHEPCPRQALPLVLSTALCGEKPPGSPLGGGDLMFQPSLHPPLSPRHFESCQKLGGGQLPGWRSQDIQLPLSLPVTRCVTSSKSLSLSEPQQENEKIVLHQHCLSGVTRSKKMRFCGQMLEQHS